MFKCDKQKSLHVIREILQHIRDVKVNGRDGCGAICVNECMDPEEQNTDTERCIDFKHKLSYIELDISASINDDEPPEHVDQIDILTGEVRRTDKVVLYDSSEITDQDEIDLTAYLHDSCAACDISYPKFTYNDKHKCWIIMDDFWCAPNGIDITDDCTVHILSFDAYPECSLEHGNRELGGVCDIRQ